LPDNLEVQGLRAQVAQLQAALHAAQNASDTSSSQEAPKPDIPEFHAETLGFKKPHTGHLQQAYQPSEGLRSAVSMPGGLHGTRIQPPLAHKAYGETTGDPTLDRLAHSLKKPAAETLNPDLATYFLN
jgi:hypothetical protein